jgi:hypothetical protein
LVVRYNVDKALKFNSIKGKSPVFVDPNCDMKSAAHRILWGKTANAGQVYLLDLSIGT